MDLAYHYVQDTAITYEYDTPSLDEFTDRIVWMEKFIGEHTSDPISSGTAPKMTS